MILSLTATVAFVAVVSFLYLRKPYSRRRAGRRKGPGLRAVQLEVKGGVTTTGRPYPVAKGLQSSLLPDVDVVEDVVEFTYV